MTNHPDDRFNALAQSLGFDFSGEIKIGGHYVPVVQHQQTVYVSGQIPRVGDRVMVTGCAGHEVSLPQAQLAAKGNQQANTREPRSGWPSFLREPPSNWI